MESDWNSKNVKSKDSNNSIKIDFKNINKRKQKKIISKQNDNIRNFLSDMVKNEESQKTDDSEEFISEISYYRKRSNKKGQSEDMKSSETRLKSETEIRVKKV